MKLYSYWRSTTSVRVRIALNLKGVAYDIETIDLPKGEQKADSYAALNPMKGVPTLVLDDGTALTQSMAILDYIDTVWPEPPLYPADPRERALVDAAAHAIALDIHPVNNLKVLGYLKGTLGHSQDETVDWMRHWMHEGFTAFQQLIRPGTPFCFGDTIGMADLCLVGQMVNARRWGLDLAPFARLVEIDARARERDAVQRGMPENQPDAQPT
ncbi:maleylacetoacetate isomerase/maleylpyruvate isomerase [Lutimaribacter pacificus]|uniref:Maleylacetoacetate isomerase n=1 Tax=Lutimaribacter pacificus TaxID=391948 RepID=A0A1H0HVI5_9RHOB|nr:maleylacetoacetate isomerase [Lutimaribacter pacificus]SDO23000.1 maleylacetoacetate isomerase/maleylpyruvate isomerase [Lutimaribacter pacificus]SHK30729.1 maleylacetoacetate isomerase [Lutimaribacter pacificus]